MRIIVRSGALLWLDFTIRLLTSLAKRSCATLVLRHPSKLNSPKRPLDHEL
jgi:hypothetical protein